MKKILVVSPCVKRRNTIGLIGVLLDSLENIDHTRYSISLYDTNYFETHHNPKDYKVDNYYSIRITRFDVLMRNVPRVRTYYAKKRVIMRFEQLLKEYGFDFIVVYQIPWYADELVSIAHKYNSKIVFEPFGSDILRVSDDTKKKLMRAFNKVDAVCGRSKSGTLIAAKEVYKVPEGKIKEQRLYVKGVQVLSELMGQFSRKEMMEDMGVPYSEYNIICGYSGRESHRHRIIIESIACIKEQLPVGYQLIFPMTYGGGSHHELILDYASQLKTLCEENELKAVFLTDFMSDKHMAFLHLITDLFIEIQPTDNGNAFMIEALYAGNQIITGRWLNYQRFEQFGEPYYLIDKPEDLPNKLTQLFNGREEKVQVSQELKELLSVPANYDRSSFWSNLVDELCK